MKFYRYPVLIILVFCLICIVLFPNLGKWLIKKDQLMYADAIVVLIGSVPDRALETADLYNQGFTRKIMMVKSNAPLFKQLEQRGVSLETNTEQTFSAITGLGVPKDSILILAGDASDTGDEAVIIREYIRDFPLMDTLLIVTSASHTRRAYMIFKQAFKKYPENIKFCVVPSKYSRFQPEKWWTRKSDVQIVLLEYMKFVNFILFEKKKIKNR